MSGQTSKPRNILSTIFIALILTIGIGLLLYPTVSNWWNEMHQSRAIADYTTAVENLKETDYAALRKEAEQYNADLRNEESKFVPTDKMSERYFELLDIGGNGIMGYIEIPSINVKLPIYHGTDEAVLQIATGHIQGSSVPVGGPSTHAAISGHRGLTSAKLFTQLDKVTEGDMFYIHILNEILAYQVDQINVVLPNEMDLLAIEDNKDFCTLITCTPYGVNSHRLLVRGARTEMPTEETEQIMLPAETTQDEGVSPAVIGAVVLIVLLVISVAIYAKWQHTKK